MDNIIDVFYIVGRGCVITVNNNNYKVGQNLMLYDSKNIFTYTISGIEYSKALLTGKIMGIGLLLKAVDKQLIDDRKIHSGMTINIC